MKKLKLKAHFSYLLAFSMAAIWILSETTLDSAQIVLEIFLCLVLFYLSFKQKYDLVEISILAVNFLVIILSFFLIEINLAVISAKNITLALLSYLVLSRYDLKSEPILILAILCISLILVQVFITKRYPLEIQDYLVTSFWLMESRPLGLFLSEQGSAAFLAVVFFGYTFKKKLWFVDIYILFRTGVATMFLALIGAKLFRWNRTFSRLIETSVFTSVILFFALLIGLYLFKDLFLASLFYVSKNSFSSAEIILNQLFNPVLQLNSFRLLPDNLADFEQTLKMPDLGYTKMPELGYTKYFVEYGAIFFFSMLYLLLKSLKNWRVFLIISIFHFTILHIPLVIYVLFLFQPSSNEKSEL